ncbi:acyl-CoA carboxylase subunit epsilon [Streptomyces cylindrosporus]|uniref:Acyl-CoA carboxylase subunit epsilon n=1 Tax=Streptomyces cylindrosporus TaxID=2927583 RepID=A0ABS9YNX2_9ACTN|nr:acyl-CoA carboxylase subunit epsilon [Streptomyces cylindrosporus]MCI3278835.1 acyl-CoA carboxylase subunit epsilon [Streptomyces cylindrosporus]
MPDIQVRRGHATPEELAALVTVLLARSAATAPAGTPRHRAPNWHRLERALRHSGARGWSRERAAAGPRSAGSSGRA